MARSLLILVVSTLTVRALFASQAPDERLRLINADILERSTVNGQAVQKLTGNVKFQKGEMTLTTARAVFYGRDDRTHLRGDVVMTRPGERLTCDSLIFYNAQDMLHAIGDVHFIQEEHTLDCQDLIYWTELDSGIARTDVVMNQDERRLTAGEFRYQKTDGIRGASFHAFGSVVVQEGERVIRARTMDYSDPVGTLDLSGDASLRETDQEIDRSLSGKRIRLIYKGEALRNGLVEENAEATALILARLSPDRRDRQAFTDVLTSRGMEADFIDDKLRVLRLVGMASSTYHVVEDTILQGVNSATGDTMAMDFDDDGKIMRIQVLGGARGRFVPEAGNTDVDTVVIYQSEYIDYDILGEATYLERGARVDYKENGLASGYIRVTWSNNLMRAEVAFEERPTLLQEGSDPMYGQIMEFDLATERGRVVKGRTQLENGHYHGEVVHRHPGDIYYVRHSMYTTCSLDSPHFYFGSQRMKLLQGDKVIAKPIVLHLMDIPILGLPFIIFPNESGGRRTGWIMPSYGRRGSQGRYLKGLGYFWVISDYADLRSLVDIYDEASVSLEELFKYNKRYKFDGSIRARLIREVEHRDISNIFTENAHNIWTGSWRHNHRIDPTQRLHVDAQYTSSPDVNRRYGVDLPTRLKQKIRSNASYSKRWPGTPYHLNLGLSEEYDLQAVNRLENSSPTRLGQENIEKSRIMPQLSFGRGSGPIFKPGRGQSSRWYHNLYVSLNSNLKNQQRILWTALADTTGSLFWPDEQDRTIENKTSLRNTSSLRFQPNVLKYITTSINLSIAQDWTPTYRQARFDSLTGAFLKADDGRTVIFDEVRQVAVRHTGKLSLTANTTLYGLLPVSIGSLEAIRHVIKPSISYSYAPDFSRPLFGYDLGYFQHSQDPDEAFDRFYGSSVGPTPGRESQSMGISIANLFQTKRVIEDQEVKTNILNWDLSTAYNFTADSLNFSPIRSSFRSPFLKKLNLDIRMAHDIYEWDSQNRKRVHQVRSVPRLSRMDASSRLRLSGKRFSPLDTDQVDESVQEDTLQLDEDLDEDFMSDKSQSLRRGSKVSTVSKGSLWEATLALRYSLEPSRDINRETFWLNTNFKFNIGPGWAITYNTRFDLLSQELVSHQIQIYRELHCWEFFFDWNPSGFGRGFLFRVNVIDADLKDIKYENKGGRQSGLTLGGLY